MATSGALSTSNEKIKYKITVTQNSQNVSANTSNVTVSVRFYRTNTGYETYGTGTVYCKINGTTYNAAVTSSQKITNSGIVLFSKTLNISHNNDGTKTLTCSAWISHQQFSSNEQSYSQTLTTIPRASKLTIANGTLGTAQTVTVTRHSTSFRHKIIYGSGSEQGYIAGSSSTYSTATSISWTPPLSLASQSGNGTSVTVGVAIETYNGTTLIGTNRYTITCSIPSGVVPTISSFTLTEAVDGLAAQFGTYVNGKSKITWNATASGTYGSTIKSYSVSIAGQSKTGASGTTGVINTTAGTNTATVTVTDSRGRSASKSVTFTVSDYAAPQINFSVTRALSDGTADDDGKHLKWNVVCNVSPVNNKNTAKYGLGWKLISDSNYTAIETDITPNTYSVNKAMTLQSPTFSTDNTYDVKFSVTDFFGTVSKVVKLQSGSPVFDITADGSGMSFGMVSERNENGFRKPIGVYGGFKGINIKATAENQVDLDEKKQAGIYYCAATTHLLNKPTTSNGTAELIVLEGGDNEQLEQVYRVITKEDTLEYKRCYYSGSWGGWVRTAGSLLLWDGATETTNGGYYMTAGHTAWLKKDGDKTNEKLVSNQPTGIVLVFSRYNGTDGKSLDEDFTCHFVPKGLVAKFDGKLHAFNMSNAYFNFIATKAIHIYDNKLVGHSLNDYTGTVSGITYNNKDWVLRYVYGV